MSQTQTSSSNRPRLLILGASGFVGSRWFQAARSRFDVIAAARNPPAEDGWIRVDVADRDSVRAAFDQARPQYVTLLAALSDIDRCEREPALAEQINVAGPAHVARECARSGARLLATSTDALFDGKLGFYREAEAPTPCNCYGRTKARGEQAIAEILPGATIVRLSLVLGTSALPGGNSYLEKVAGNLRAGNPIISPGYEVRNPIDVVTLCAFLAELTLRDDAAGLFHIGASDKITRYDLARAIAAGIGADPKLIVPQDAPVPGRAPRGTDTFLATDRLRAVCHTEIPTSQQVIARALALL